MLEQITKFLKSRYDAQFSHVRQSSTGFAEQIRENERQFGRSTDEARLVQRTNGEGLRDDGLAPRERLATSVLSEKT